MTDTPCKLTDTIQRHRYILQEAAVVERLRRESNHSFHPTLEHALFIYDQAARSTLASVFRSYIDIADASSVPIVLHSPTWRANRDRIEAADCPRTVNEDAMTFMHDLRAGSDAAILLAGLISCRNDCYMPDQALSPSAALGFHAWQIERIASGKPDFLFAATLPSLSEALGIAEAMSQTALPFIISFVIDATGRLLDGTALADAIRQIDDCSPRAPYGYSVNCAYPSFVLAAGTAGEDAIRERLVAYQGNSSSLAHAQLNEATSIQSNSIEDWCTQMLELHAKFQVPMLGGCCGTGTAHLSRLAELLKVR